MQLRPETKLALWLNALALALGVVRIFLRSRGFTVEQGHGGMALLLGVGACSTALWCVLAIRALAAGGSVAQAVDDGLTSLAVSFWLVALLPLRPSNFWPNGGTDDFAYAYLPAVLVGVPLLLGVRQLLAERTPLLLAARFVVVLSPVMALTGGLIRFLSRGAGADDVSLRAFIIAGVLALAAVALVVTRRARQR